MIAAVAALQGSLLQTEHATARRPVVPFHHGIHASPDAPKLCLGDKSIRMNRKFFHALDYRLRRIIFGCTDAIFLNGYAR
jgi:hypothetical protein